MIIQLLPDAKEESIDVLEEIIAKMPPITSLIDKVNHEHSQASYEEKITKLAEEIFKCAAEDYSLKIVSMREIDWVCDCSMERLEKALMTIGVKDLKEIIEEDGRAEMVCQFCLKKYNFDKEHLERILESIS